MQTVSKLLDQKGPGTGDNQQRNGQLGRFYASEDGQARLGAVWAYLWELCEEDGDIGDVETTTNCESDRFLIAS